MLREVLEALDPAPGAVLVDATFGRGGHALELLKRVLPGGRVIGLDRDPEAVDAGRALAREWRELTIARAAFSELESVTREHGVHGLVNGMLLDLGVSSPQLDAPARGFSFRNDGPLDMRMDPDRGQSAADWLREVAERDLAHVIRRLGEEPSARRVARAIVAERVRDPILTTGRLAGIVAGAIPGAGRRRRHPATRTFQAIRMAVNHEIEELEDVLPQAFRVLAPGGRLAVISFHSLEDRIVKRFMRDPLGRGPQPRHLPIMGDADRQPMAPVGKACVPGDEEIARNPRARSARLRVAERLA